MRGFATIMNFHSEGDASYQYVYLKIISSTFYGRYGDLIKQYEVPISRMLDYILEHDHLQCHPTFIRNNTTCDLVTEIYLTARFDLFTKSKEYLQRV